jgi:hypothetical protein
VCCALVQALAMREAELERQKFLAREEQERQAEAVRWALITLRFVSVTFNASNLFHVVECFTFAF